MPDDVRAELRAALTDTAVTEQFPLLLTVRRIREAVNSTGTRVPGLVPGGTNPAGLHPDDLAGLGIADGQVVTLRSVSGRLRATVRADATLARGTVSMTHCFGSVDPRSKVGVNVNALTGTGDGVQTINAMPTMTAVPVAVERAAPEEDV
jgi:anaerobic selenocysteine-containing dehydrogenase